MPFTLIENISGTECIGSSRQKIVRNFVNLETQIISLSANTIYPVDTNTIDLTYNNFTRSLEGSLKSNSVQTSHLQNNVITTDKLSAEVVTYPKLATLNSATESNAVTPRLAKAWVTFDGTTNPPTIKSSYNVSGVSRNNVGDYTISFTSPLPASDYSVSGISRSNTLNSSNVGFGAVISIHPNVSPTPFNVRIWNVNLAVSTNPTSIVTAADSSFVSLQIFA